MKCRFSPRIIIIVVLVLLVVMLFMSRKKDGYVIAYGSKVPEDFNWPSSIAVQDTKGSTFIVDGNYVEKDNLGMFKYVDAKGTLTVVPKQIPITAVTPNIGKRKVEYPYCYTNVYMNNTICLATELGK